MGRARVVAGCLLSVFAFAAIAAGSASAAEPEFLECAKVKGTGRYIGSLCNLESTKHKGKYEAQTVTHPCTKAAKVNRAFTGAFDDKACSMVNATHEGKFELEEGIGDGRAFRGKGEITIGSESGVAVTCEGASDTALVTGPSSLAHVQLELHGCSINGTWRTCTSPGAKTGTVRHGGSVGHTRLHRRCKPRSRASSFWGSRRHDRRIPVLGSATRIAGTFVLRLGEAQNVFENSLVLENYGRGEEGPALEGRPAFPLLTLEFNDRGGDGSCGDRSFSGPGQVLELKA